MRIKEIMEMTADAFNKLNESALRKVTTQLVSAANKRIKRFEGSGQKSPALSHVLEHGGKFSTRDKTFNQIRAEYARARRFLESETGNIRGARRVETRVITGLHNAGVDISPEQYNQFWSAYEKLKELSPEVADKRFKYMAMKELSNRIEGNTDPDKIAQAITSDFTKIYEGEEQIAQELADVSDFFETDENL